MLFLKPNLILCIFSFVLFISGFTSRSVFTRFKFTFAKEDKQVAHEAITINCGGYFRYMF